jgi:hypothetical protein
MSEFSAEHSLSRALFDGEAQPGGGFEILSVRPGASTVLTLSGVGSPP